MPKSGEIKPEVIERKVNLVNTIQSASLQNNGSATSSGTPTPGRIATPGGGTIDWKKKYNDEFDKRFAIEEQYDDLQTQVSDQPLVSKTYSEIPYPNQRSWDLRVILSIQNHSILNCFQVCSHKSTLF